MDYFNLHLVDAFIQSDLLEYRLYIYCQYVCSLGIEPTTFVLLTQCSTTEPQENLDYINDIITTFLGLRCASFMDSQYKHRNLSDFIKISSLVF